VASAGDNHSLRTVVLLGAAGLLVGGLAISRDSYWIDEATVARKALTPTLGAWWQSMLTDGGSSLQLAFYFLFAWTWSKVAGVSEFALRGGNVLWFLPGFLILTQALGGRRPLRWALGLVVLGSPFVWYYLNEARPYAMQIGASFLVFGALYRLGMSAPDQLEGQRCWMAVLCFGALLLAASGMLAMLWLGAYLGAALLSSPKAVWTGLAKHYSWWWGPTLLCLFGLGLFYLWTMTTGARASAIASTNIKTMLFIPYELLGFSGLGPGRSVLRTAGPGVFRPWLPWLAAYGCGVLLVLAAGWRQIAATTSRRSRLCWLGAFALVAAFILGVGVATKFRVLGRHCAPLLPLFVWMLAEGVAASFGRRGWVGRLGLGLFLALGLVSGLMLRFNPRHAKDDYRDAAILAREALARGQRVWWNADDDGGFIYHVPLSVKPSAAKAAYCFANPAESFAQNLPAPDIIIASKPDIYDVHGALAAYLKQGGFVLQATLPAFTFWQPPAPSPKSGVSGR
jgi:hypothetical protein